MADLPCDPEGVCMVCKIIPPDSDVLLCGSCTSPWHMQCLRPPLHTVPEGDWSCPDCSLSGDGGVLIQGKTGDDLVSRIRAIQEDPSLSEAEKAKRRQQLMSENGTSISKNKKPQDSKPPSVNFEGEVKSQMMKIFDENLNCIFCMQLAERPVTAPCGHNFCLKCFEKWIGQGKKNCGKCRSPIPAKFASQPRINAALVFAIRMAKTVATSAENSSTPKPFHYIQNENRPDKAFVTERAVRAGKANACSGKIFVTTPPDHFGPITAENDPDRGQGVLVGESWEDRMECRQWGTHLPHVAGIAGQSDHGAQSVCLSGGYEDDEDHGEWFLYTGSGGRDLSGNKRTNKEQSFDQTFEKLNEALRISCKKGYPVRVVRSHKEKRSSYAPDAGVRYDGIYRIEMCWRKKGIQGFKVCRYLFVRCDNEPAPWTSDEHGDRPRPLPEIKELKFASDLTERKSAPSWDWKDGHWGWTRPPPSTRKTEDGKYRKQLTMRQKLLREFGCESCRKVLEQPLSTPCGHNFCKTCLEKVFSGQSDVRERTGVGGRTLRVQKVVKKCPTCQGDITEFLVNPQVNRQMENVIQSLKRDAAEEGDDESPTESRPEELLEVTKKAEKINICEKAPEKCEEKKEKKQDIESESEAEIGSGSNKARSKPKEEQAQGKESKQDKNSGRLCKEAVPVSKNSQTKVKSGKDSGKNYDSEGLCQISKEKYDGSSKQAQGKDKSESKQDKVSGRLCEEAVPVSKNNQTKGKSGKDSGKNYGSEGLSQISKEEYDESSKKKRNRDMDAKQNGSSNKRSKLAKKEDEKENVKIQRRTSPRFASSGTGVLSMNTANTRQKDKLKVSSPSKSIQVDSDSEFE